MHFELQPAALPSGYCDGILPLAAAKAHCRVTHVAEDDLIEALRDAAIDLVERMSGLSIGERTGLLWVGAGFGPVMRLSPGPVTAVTGIAYDGPTGEVTLTSDDWRLGPHGRLLPAYGTDWPADCEGNVRVTFNAGYGSTTRPSALLSAVRMMTAHMYENREAVAGGQARMEVPLGVRQMVNAVRMPVI